MENYKKLLTDLYNAHDPERIKQIDYFLEKYKGKEAQFYSSQKTKYKSKKPVSDSKKIIEEALARIKSKSDSNDKALSKKETPPVPQKTVESEVIIDKPKPKKATPITEEPTIAPIVESKTEAPVIEQETQPSQAKTSVVEEKPKEIKKESPPPVKEKKEVWFEEKKKEASKTSYVASPPKQDKHFKKKYFLYILGIVLLILILAVIAFFIFFYTPTKKSETPKENTKTTVVKKEDANATKTTNIDTAKTTTVTNIQKKPASTTRQKAVGSSGIRLRKGDISLPAYFVACSAVKTEKLAIDKANELKSKGFEASYYWIPDFIPNGNSYFKVVIGPFNKGMDAMKKLTPVQERAEFDAYVLELK